VVAGAAAGGVDLPEEVATAATATPTTAAAITAMAMIMPRWCRCPDGAPVSSEGGGRGPTATAWAPAVGRRAGGANVVGARAAVTAGDRVDSGAMGRPQSWQNLALGALSCPTGQGLINSMPHVGQNWAVTPVGGRG
jgi:hypothetical protein